MTTFLFNGLLHISYLYINVRCHPRSRKYVWKQQERMCECVFEHPIRNRYGRTATGLQGLVANQRPLFKIPANRVAGWVCVGRFLVFPCRCRLPLEEDGWSITGPSLHMHLKACGWEWTTQYPKRRGYEILWQSWKSKGLQFALANYECFRIKIIRIYDLCMFPVQII